MDLQLLLALIVGVALIIWLIIGTRFDAFMALLAAAVATGLIAGVPAVETAEHIATGFGNTLAAIGIVIGLGVMIGKLLEVSGGADALALAFLRLAGRGREDWAMTGTGAVVSVPVFCDSGYVIMHPLSRSLSRQSGRSFVTLALALGAGMTITHHLVPPTPGPLAVAGIMGVDLGLLIIAGLIIGLPMIPTVVLYAKWIGPKLDDRIDPRIREEVRSGVATAGAGTGAASAGGDDTSRRTEGTPPAEGERRPEEPDADEAREARELPSAGLAFLPLLVPLVLIVGNTVSTAVAEDTQVDQILSFIGEPFVALLIGVAIAIYTLVPRATSRGQVTRWLADGAASAGLIILITGAGGAFGEVLRQSGVGDALAEAVVELPLPAFILPFLVATLVRFAQGSGTVAMITGASLTAPLLPGLGLDPLVAALGVCIGSIFFSYFNDSYFWVVTKFIGLEGTAALRGWSGITTALWAVGFVMLSLAALIL
jgi:gluconate:H+ symporter, GntP family